MKFASIFIILISTGCWSGKQLPYPLFMENPKPVDSTMLGFDGYYTQYDTTRDNTGAISNDRFAAIHQVRFTRDNKIRISHGAILNTQESLLTIQNMKKYDTQENTGTYVVEGKTIYAFVPVYIVGYGPGASGNYKLHYTGTIKNRDTILNWQAVPPFPKRFQKRKRKDIANMDIVTPQMIYFKKYYPGN